MVAATHSHSLHGKAFASIGGPLEPITQDACAFLEDHGIYSDYQGVVNETDLTDEETARMVRAQISGALPGWFQVRPLWKHVTAEQPGLFD